MACVLVFVVLCTKAEVKLLETRTDKRCFSSLEITEGFVFSPQLQTATNGIASVGGNPR